MPELLLYWPITNDMPTTPWPILKARALRRSDLSEEKKSEKLPAYPGLKIERAVNGWVVRELTDEYEDRRSWIAGNQLDLLDLVRERIDEFEVQLQEGKLRI